MVRARLERSVVVGAATTLAMSIVTVVGPQAHSTPAAVTAAAPAGFLARTPSTVLQAVVATAPRTVNLPTSAVPASATAVALSVQVTRPTRTGVLVVGARGAPAAVHQSVVAGRSFVTSTIAPTAYGPIQVSMSAGSATVVVRLTGVFAPGHGDQFAPRSPTRVFDDVLGTHTRTIDLPLSAVPIEATSVVLDAEVGGTAVSSALIVEPASTKTSAPVQVVTAGQTATGSVTVPVVDGHVRGYLTAGSGRVRLDVVGVYAPDAGSRYVATTPTSVYDATVHASTKTITATASLVPATASAVVAAAQVLAPTASGYLGVSGVPAKPTVTARFTAGAPAANLAVAPLTAGRFTATLSAGAAEVRLTVVGYFAPITSAPPSWSTRVLPFDRDGPDGGRIWDVSCPAAGHCVAIGATGGIFHSGSEYASVLSGGTWRTSLMAPLEGYTGGYLRVSCPGLDECYAFGVFQSRAHPYDSPTYLGVAHLLDGVWSARIVDQIPATDNGDLLDAFTCPDTTHCVAVGQYPGPDGTLHFYAESLTTGRWARSQLPDAPQNAAYLPLLRSVACSGPSSCVAVGSTMVTTATGESSVQPLIERFADGSWRVSTPAGPSSLDGARLASVTCGVNGRCTAFGDYEKREAHPLVYRDDFDFADPDAGLISELPAPPGDDSADPANITCSTTADCVALGGDGNGGNLGLVLAEDTWTATSLPVPDYPATVIPAFARLVCVDSTDCVAAGSIVNNQGSDSSAVETYADGKWSYTLIPELAPEAVLTSVSCPSGGPCSVAGYDVGASQLTTPIGATEDGPTWSFDDLPDSWNSVNQYAYPMSRVSCAGVGDCVFADANILADAGFATRVTAGARDEQQLPVGLRDLSCPSEGVCFGAAGNVPTTQPLGTAEVEQLSGNTWTAFPIRVPDENGGDLRAISCAAPTACTAIGSLDSSGQTLVATLADGAWSTSALDLGQGVSVDDVSCPTPTTCALSGWGPTGPLLVQRTDSGWTVEPITVPDDLPAGYSGHERNALSCAEPGRCVLVQTWTDTDAFEPAYVAYVYRLQAGSWSEQQFPAVSGGRSSRVLDVSCSEPDRCRAVGSIGVGSGQYPLVETLSG